MVEAGEGDQAAEADALRRRGRCRRRRPRRGRRRAAWSSGSRAGRSSSSTATSSPAGSHHGSAIALGEDRGVHAALLGVGGERRGVDPQQVGQVVVAERPDRARAAAARAPAAGRETGRRITHSSRARVKPWRAASRAAAGWSACDHTCCTASPASASTRSSSAVATPCPRAAGATARLSVAVVEHREAVGLDPCPARGRRRARAGRLVERVASPYGAAPASPRPAATGAGWLRGPRVRPPTEPQAVARRGDGASADDALGVRARSRRSGSTKR